MFHWEWLLPIILAFWFLVTLIRKTEEERRNRERAGPNSDRPPPPARPRRQTTDIDRFLEEVNRRRGQAVERKPRTVTEARPTVPRTVVPSPPPGKSAAPPRPPAVQPVTSVLPPTVSVLAAATVPSVEPVTAVPATKPAQGVKWPGTDEARQATSAAAGTTPAGSADSLLDLLRSPQSLQTIFLLREILAPPRCRRPPVAGRPPEATSR
jgi:hypothetical protein